MMRKCLNTLLVVTIALFGSSCRVLSKLYTTGTNGSVNSYVVKPEYKGENSSAVYVSGQVTTAKHEQIRQAKEDKKMMGSINIYKSFTRKDFNFFFGGHAIFGNFTFNGNEDTIIKAGEKHNFYGLGGMSGINYNISTSEFEIRPIGMKLYLNYEFGSYQKRLSELEEIRRNSLTEVNFEIGNQEIMLSGFLESEILYKINRKHSIGFGVFYGINSLGQTYTSASKGSFGVMSSYRYKKIVFNYVLEQTTDPYLNEPKNINSHKFGLTYKLF